MVKKVKKKELFFNKICKAFPKKYKFSNRKVNLTLMLSNNKNIKKLNKYFRNKNKPTDILSFPFKNKIRISKNNYIGDIIISYNYINTPKYFCEVTATPSIISPLLISIRIPDAPKALYFFIPLNNSSLTAY